MINLLLIKKLLHSIQIKNMHLILFLNICDIKIVNKAAMMLQTLRNV